MKKRANKIIYIIAAVAVAAILIYYASSFFYYPKCNDELCFKDSLWKCKKVGFTNYKENSTWMYNIKGMSSEGCEVYVKLVSLKTDVSKESLSGKEMSCYIPKNILGAFMPEEKIEYCHGILKEEIQKMMIEQMHLYIVQNIGKISQANFSI